MQSDARKDAARLGKTFSPGNLRTTFKGNGNKERTAFRGRVQNLDRSALNLLVILSGCGPSSPPPTAGSGIAFHPVTPADRGRSRCTPRVIRADSPSSSRIGVAPVRNVLALLPSGASSNRIRACRLRGRKWTPRRAGGSGGDARFGQSVEFFFRFSSSISCFRRE